MELDQAACADCTEKERQNRAVSMRLLSALQRDMGNERSG